MNEPGARRFRRAVHVTSLVGAGILVLAGVLTTPRPDGSGTRSYLETIAANPGRTQVSAVLLHFGYMLLVPAAIALFTLAGETRLARAGIVAAVLGAVSISGNVVVDLLDLAAAESLTLDRAEVVNETAEGYWAAGFFIAPAFLGTILGFTVLAVAAWRAGGVPGWLAAAMPAAWIAFAAQTTVGSILLLAVFGSVALRMTRLPEPGSHGRLERTPAVAEAAVRT